MDMCLHETDFQTGSQLHLFVLEVPVQKDVTFMVAAQDISMKKSRLNMIKISFEAYIFFKNPEFKGYCNAFFQNIMFTVTWVNQLKNSVVQAYTFESWDLRTFFCRMSKIPRSFLSTSKTHS